MINLKKKDLPSAVLVDGVFYSIHTDFRFWLLFPEVYKTGARLTDLDFFYNGIVPQNRAVGALELLSFYNPPQELPRSTERTGEKLFDYIKDEDLIYAAFIQNYGIDLKETNLHWHKFLCLFYSIRDTKLNDVINIRMYNGSDREIIKEREAWRLESDVTQEEKERLDYFNSL